MMIINFLCTILEALKHTNAMRHPQESRPIGMNPNAHNDH
jgi:hypothetical protein